MTTPPPPGRAHPSAEPAGDALEAALEELLAGLVAASAATEREAGVAAEGVRAVELAPGRMRYLCALPGPAFLCVDEGGRPLTEEREVHQAAVASLAFEHLEGMVDVSRLDELSAAAARVLAAVTEPPEVPAAVAAVAEAGRALAAWRASPLRAVASVPELDRASALQERAYRAYGAFVHTSDPLAARQQDLPAETVAALRGFEEAAARAGITERLAERLGQVVVSCDEGAAEIVAAHVTPLRA
ncbi:MAG TPA: hypothetical protein VNT51_07070 [Miltoncostaeaceae bacterium]|nr:hypothetical protein [Miltoncostaeaceae bacterium]